MDPVLSSRAAFSLFGFPIHVRPGFVMFMLLVVVVNGGDELGFWIAGSAAVLTLLHELGHAFAARATGSRAEISLDFLAGYASFVPVRPLTRLERAGISIAGPAVQIGVGVGALVLMGVNPLDRDAVTDSAAALAIWWTGPIMGLFNLVPVLPFDGGHIAQAGLDKLLPGRSAQLMVRISVALTAGFAVLLFVNPRLRGLAVFALFPLMFQLQMLFAGQARRRPDRSPGAVAEAHAWRHRDVSAIPHGLVPSPWFRASQQLQQGQADTARAVLLADFAERGQPDWWPPDAAAPEELAPLVDLLPRPLPHGRTYSEHTLATILLRLGRFDEAARYAAASFARTPLTGTAVVVARAAGGLDDVETAVGWLQAAARAGTDPDGLADAIDRAPELAVVRDDGRVLELRAALDEP